MELVVEKICTCCGKKVLLRKRQRVCEACQKENHKLACAYYRKNGWTKFKRAERTYNTRPERPKGFTFSLRSGKWYWEHPNGLENGPFDTIKEARKEAWLALS